MKKINYLFYSQYLKGKSLLGKEILVSKTKTSYLIGPLLNKNFDNNSFFKRLTSNSIYSLKIYKKMSSFKCKKMIKKYKANLSDNEVLEIFKNGNIVKHKIIKVPGEKNE
ncbi:MAG: hypothetical protein IKF19_05620 [Bacilli bacterium]|nr:hypothetical protein [Bacilli bacterium]